MERKIKGCIFLSFCQYIPDLVTNKTSVELNEYELKLLNKGLNFASPYDKFPLRDLIVGIEEAALRLNYEKVIELRNESSVEILSSKLIAQQQRQANDFHGFVKCKRCVYHKSR